MARNGCSYENCGKKKFLMNILKIYEVNKPRPKGTFGEGGGYGEVVG